jgi:hypothetical protein
MVTADSNLQHELGVYERNKAKFLSQYPGFYVLIKGDEVLGPYPTAQAAYEDGLNRFKLQPFLVKQVLLNEPVGYVPI